MAPELFPFRFYDPIRRRWIQARYKASRADIEARGGVITGPGWVPKDVDGRSHAAGSPAAAIAEGLQSEIRGSDSSSPRDLLPS